MIWKNRIFIYRKVMLLFIGCIFASISILFLYNFSQKVTILDNNYDVDLAFYVDDVISSFMPVQNSGYTLDTTKSSCNHGVSFVWDEADWSFETDFQSYSATDNSRTKCDFYFVKNRKTVNTVLGNIEVNNYTPDFTKSSCAASDCESHEVGIYETTDDDGTSYYYRGSVENNYVKFAGYYWRIIRINGNGSIRMIYDGTVAHTNGEASEDRYYTTSKFNDISNDNMYAGYMYTSGEGHGTGSSSVIKTVVDQFYQEKLSSYANYLDTESGFCGDRSTLNLASGVGTGTIDTYYAGYLRVEMSTPNLSCSNSSDYYTVSLSSKGNKALTYLIGLITADEAMLAGHGGGVFNGDANYQALNINSYLTIGHVYWTMTPVGSYHAYGNGHWFSRIFYIYSNGGMDDSYSIGEYDVRPVINIKSTVTISGSGTMNDPYTIS